MISSIVFIYSSQCTECQKVNKALKHYGIPVKGLCVDNLETRKRILQSKRFSIDEVPALIIRLDKGVDHLYKGDKAHKQVLELGEQLNQSKHREDQQKRDELQTYNSRRWQQINRGTDSNAPHMSNLPIDYDNLQSTVRNGTTESQGISNIHAASTFSEAQVVGDRGAPTVEHFTSPIDNRVRTNASNSNNMSPRFASRLGAKAPMSPPMSHISGNQTNGLIPSYNPLMSEEQNKMQQSVNSTTNGMSHAQFNQYSSSVNVPISYTRANTPYMPSAPQRNAIPRRTMSLSNARPPLAPTIDNVMNTSLQQNPRGLSVSEIAQQAMMKATWNPDQPYAPGLSDMSYMEFMRRKEEEQLTSPYYTPNEPLNAQFSQESSNRQFEDGQRSQSNISYSHSPVQSNGISTPVGTVPQSQLPNLSNSNKFAPLDVDPQESYYEPPVILDRNSQLNPVHQALQINRPNGFNTAQAQTPFGDTFSNNYFSEPLTREGINGHISNSYYVRGEPELDALQPSNRGNAPNEDLTEVRLDLRETNQRESISSSYSTVSFDDFEVTSVGSQAGGNSKKIILE